MDAVYRDNILGHFKDPIYRGRLDEPTIRERDANPLCGDDLTIDLFITPQGTIGDCRFCGYGCAISQAAADILCEEIIGKDLKTILNMKKEEMLELLGISLGPVRVKCGLLAYKIVKVGIIKYEGLKEEGDHEVQSL